MKKALASFFAVLAFVAFANTAHAAPLSDCVISSVDVDGNDLLTCDLYESDGTTVTADDPFPTPDWFTPSYVRILDGIVLKHLVSFFSGGDGLDHVTLYSGVDIGTAVVAGPSIDVAWGGATTTFYVNFQTSIQNSGGGAFTCNGVPSETCDTINVHSVVGEGVIPEPATLTLFALGGAMGAARRLRNRRKK